MKKIHNHNANISDDVIVQKGVYSYDYVNSFDWLQETPLLPQEEFYSKLNDEPSTDADHAKAQ